MKFFVELILFPDVGLNVRFFKCSYCTNSENMDWVNYFMYWSPHVHYSWILRISFFKTALHPPLWDLTRIIGWPPQYPWSLQTLWMCCHSSNYWWLQNSLSNPPAMPYLHSQMLWQTLVGSYNLSSHNQHLLVLHRARHSCQLLAFRCSPASRLWSRLHHTFLITC